MKGLKLISSDKASPYYIGDKLFGCACLGFDYETDGDLIVTTVIFEHDEEAEMAEELFLESQKFEKIEKLTVVSHDFAQNFMRIRPANLNKPILEV